MDTYAAGSADFLVDQGLPRLGQIPLIDSPKRLMTYEIEWDRLESMAVFVEIVAAGSLAATAEMTRPVPKHGGQTPQRARSPSRCAFAATDYATPTSDRRRTVSGDLCRPILPKGAGRVIMIYP